MNDQQRMLTEMVDGLFSDLGATASMADWAAIDELALPSLLLPGDVGGFDGTWIEALIVFRLAGYHSVALPVVEAVIAARLAASTALEGRGTIADRSDGVLADGRFSGSVSGVAMSEGASYLAAPAPGGGTMLLATADSWMEPHANPAGEARDVWRFDDALAIPAAENVFRLGAFARTAQIAGGLDAALALSVSYVNDRQQFGRPLAKFQAVQQALASFACEAAAANCAAMGAAQALDRGAGVYEVAAAKLRANRAVGVGAATAHQVHGAIGFTREFGLHPVTRRLWSRRSEFGGDAFWSDELGRLVAQAGGARLWADITSFTDGVRQPA